MNKNELIKELDKQVRHLTTMVAFLKNPDYSADRFDNLHEHIDIYKFTPGEILDTMNDIVRLYGNDDLHVTASEYLKNENINKGGLK